MRRFLIGISVLGAAILSGCGKSNNGELTGVQGRKPWFQSEPYGTVFIPQGVFQSGQSDQDVFYTLNAQTKTVSVKAFYMDDTEISNNEYRQFVEWVRDSVAHKILGHVKSGTDGKEYIDWNAKLDWEKPETVESLNEMFYTENDRVFGKMEIDIRKLKFSYSYLDYNEAARRENAGKQRSEFIKKVEGIQIYPDTLVWVRDFAFSYNEPQTTNYFSHPAYDDYPVVGVSWDQAKAFCAWRTMYLNTARQGRDLASQGDFRLPTEYEWEYAARGGRNTAPYPWGGPYIRNDKGCFLANFKPGRGNYTDDGGFYTVKVYSYNPNDYGLYNMAGNVSEWTITAYDEASNSTVHDLNPSYYYNAKEGDDKVLKRKVIRGGSWKDIGFYLQNSTRTYEYQDSAKSYIGFRCVMDFLGRSIDDFR